MTERSPLEQAIHLLSKVKRTSLDPDSLSLYDEGMTQLRGLLDPKEEPAQEPEEKTDIQGWKKTIDEVMEEKLELETEKALEEE